MHFPDSRDPTRRDDEREEVRLAALSDFLTEYLEDCALGQTRSLPAYLKRYEGHEEAVAAEFLRQEQLRRGETDAGTERESNPGDRGVAADEHRIGSYRLLRELGRGGQGMVWLAEDTRIQRQVALKLLGGLFISEERRARLRREARSVANLTHPGICAVYEAEVDAEQPFIAMQLVEGCDLAQSLEQARAHRAGSGSLPTLPWIPSDRTELVRCLVFFEKAARALHVAHEAGLVHRDIKPANLFVDPKGEPVLLDFGLARDVDSVEGLTRSGDMFGTPYYMSPEQLKGGRGELDRRTDVYSLGVSVFESLTGQRPFDFESFFFLERAIRLDPPPDLRVLNPALSEDVRVVVETAIDKDSGRRYASALEFAEDLRRIREFEPISARPASAQLRLHRWARRQPALAAAATVGFLALITGLLALTWYWQDLNRRVAIGDGRHFASVAAESVRDQPDKALLAALQAAHLLGDSEGRSTLFAALDQCQIEHALGAPEVHRFWDLEFTADGRLLLASAVDSAQGISAADGKLYSFELDTGAERRVFEQGDRSRFGAPVRAIGMHPSGAAAVLGTADGELVGVDLTSGAQLFHQWPGAAQPAGRQAIQDIHFAPGAGGAEFAVQLTAGGTLIYGFPDGGLRRILPTADLSAGSVMYSPGGKRILTSSRRKDGEFQCLACFAELWDAGSGQLLRRLQPSSDEGSILWAGWNHDGSCFALSTEDGRAQVFDSSGLLVDALEGQGGELISGDFSPDGTRLALGLRHGEASSVVLWGLGQGAPLRLGPHPRGITSVAWSPDGGSLASTWVDSVRFWDPLSGDLMRTQDYGFLIIGGRWSPDGRRFVATTRAPRVPVWRASELPYLFRLRGHAGPVVWASFQGDGRSALTAGADGTLRHWSTPAGDTIAEEPAPGLLLRTLQVHAGPIRHVARAPGAPYVATAGEDGLLILTDLDQARGVGPPHRCAETVQDLALCLAPLRMLIRTDGDHVWTIDPRAPQGAQVLTGRDGTDEWTHMALEPGGGRVALAGAAGVVSLFEVETGAPLGSWRWTPEQAGLKATCADLAWRPDGGELAILGRNSRLWTFDTEGRVLTAGVEFRSRYCRWLGRGRRLLGFDGSRGVRTLLHDLDTGYSEFIESESGARAFVAVSDNGRWAAIPGRDDRVRIWDLDERELFSENACHTASLTCLAFAPGVGPPRVISSSEDGTALVWPVDPVPAGHARAPRDWGPSELERVWDSVRVVR